ncbi:hypothetical protein EAS64_14935 [Trebonia kvetii]|uniref:Uncharacterized protein n=1 Tax=Trebonia kvetii TaxID=2480626 RepID=A0A6P2BX91_9ACTN|nr:hypothetical protein [Trebonia kvetii]TVZ03759.1 hypothetical protein EAS64_14935 [Trebonia kvetii]
MARDPPYARWVNHRIIVCGYRRFHRLPGEAVERGIADRLDIGAEAVGVSCCAWVLACFQAVLPVKSVRTSSDPLSFGSMPMDRACQVHWHAHL